MPEDTPRTGNDTVVGEDECELADVHLCVRKGGWSPFTDNLEAPCTRCGEMVVFRPYVPSTSPKVCTVCAVEELATDTMGGAR